VTRSVLAILLPAAVLVGGCPAPDPAGGLTTTSPPAQFLDYNQFVCTVQPVLVKRCSYLACHGNANHALRIYSPGKLRFGDSSTRIQRDAQLTQQEVDLNFQSAAGVVYNTSSSDRTTPTQRVLLLEKPVKAIAGGSEHHGVGIFPTPDPKTGQPRTLAQDDEWQPLSAWVAGAKQPSPVSADCAMTFSNLGLNPR
jgi:hypothetical protein